MITSTANSRIKDIRKLRERKERRASGSFLAEGIRIVGSAVESGESGEGFEIDTLIVASELLTSDYGRQLVQKVSASGREILEVSSEVFRTIARKEHPQGLAAVVKQKLEMLDGIERAHISQGGSGSWIALDAVQNPGNLGTILRTHDAIGGCGVVLLDQATDPFDPTAVRASMGAIFSQRLIKTNLNDFAAWKIRSGYPVVGTSGDAELDYQALDYPMPMILLMGSEREGLHAEHLKICDHMVKIPMVGKSDSLNLAVATAVVAYEIFNQRRPKPQRG